MWYFERISQAQWVEKANEKNIYSYDLIEQNGSKVVLFNSDRNIYLTLDSNSVKWGPTLEQASINHLYDGQWLNE